MKFEEWIKQSGMTQKEVADKLGCHKSTVTKWLQGQRPNFELRMKVAELTDGAVNMRDGW